MRARYDRRPDDEPPMPPALHAPWLDEQLFGRRMVFLRGPIEPEMASRTAATLLALDAAGAEPISMHMSAERGTLAAVGEVSGAALGVFCAAARRSAFAHARFRLAEPRVSSPGGNADQVVAEAGRYLRDLEDLILRISGATGQPRSRVEDDLQSGRFLTAQDAVEYGLVAEIVKR
jgi:ATP-dependent Clp protease protease subunit